MIRRALFLGALLAFGLHASVFGDIINVPGDQPSIQAAIDAAADGDEIVVAPGTYFENINLLGKAVTLRSSAGPEVTTIDANGSGTVVKCISGEGPDTIIDGFTITGGNASSGGGMRNTSNSSPTVSNCTFFGNMAGSGGGMRNISNSNPTLANCTFTGNTATFGGAISNWASSPMMNNCALIGNSAGHDGGGLNTLGSSSSPSMIDCTLTGNSAVERGGGILNRSGGSLLLLNCAFTANSAEIGGGVANVHGGISSVTNCIFRENSAGKDGGGMYSDGGSQMIMDCTFNGNSSARDGGGMFNFSDATVTSCIFNGNTASDLGGGMFNGGGSNTMVTDCMFSGNASGYGGGLFNFTSGTVTNCAFTDNTADGDGGGMFNVFLSPTVVNCTISGNSADGDGGGMYNGGSDPAMTNCTINGNTASFGGGLFNNGGSPTVTNCTITGNWADEDGGGILNVENSGPVIANCILWTNGPNEIADSNESATTVSHSDVLGGWPGEGNIDADPMFVDADGPDDDPDTHDDNDYRLHVRSPCIDTGDNTAVPNDVTTDLDGNPRIVDGDGDGAAVVDMGAYEFQGSPCPADFNGNETVGAEDLAQLLGNWGPCPGCPADLNGDGVIGSFDLPLLLGAWGPCL